MAKYIIDIIIIQDEAYRSAIVFKLKLIIVHLSRPTGINVHVHCTTKSQREYIYVFILEQAKYKFN